MKASKHRAHVRSCLTSEREDQSFHRAIVRRLAKRLKFSKAPKSELTAGTHDPSSERNKAGNKQ